MGLLHFRPGLQRDLCPGVLCSGSSLHGCKRLRMYTKAKVTPPACCLTCMLAGHRLTTMNLPGLTGCFACMHTKCCVISLGGCRRMSYIPPAVTGCLCCMPVIASSGCVLEVMSHAVAGAVAWHAVNHTGCVAARLRCMCVCRLQALAKGCNICTSARQSCAW